VERRRLDFWLSAALVESIEDGEKALGRLLWECGEFVRFSKECPACLEGFLRVYLKSWDGMANRDEIFELLEYVVPGDYDGIYPFKEAADVEYRRDVMQPLEKIFEKKDIGYVVSLLRFYSRLLLRWANIFADNFHAGSTPSPLYYS